jgi:hypothetical protein
MNFRRRADQIIDRAHHKIACAEMSVMHSFTDADKQRALDELHQAQRFLRRAVEARDAWDAAPHDDYEEYPDVPETLAALVDQILRTIDW